jgi:AcrR family transcriptional regulator
MQLTRSRIIGAAIDLIEAEGVEAVSMRRMATELGCGVMALYNYVPSKSALLGGVADHVMSAIEVTSRAEAGWEEQVRAQAREFRRVANAHPRCAMVAVSRRPASASGVQRAEKALATLRGAGFGGQDAARIVRALAAYIMGSLMQEVGAEPSRAGAEDVTGVGPRLRITEFPQATDLNAVLHARDPDGDFEFGLDLLMNAVAALRPRAEPGRWSLEGDKNRQEGSPGECGPGATPPVSRPCAPSRTDPASARTESPAGAHAAAS